MTDYTDIRRALEKATPGPWFTGRLEGDEDNRVVSIGPYSLEDRPNKPHHYEDTICEVWENGNLANGAEDNAKLIALLRNNAEALLADAERWRMVEEAVGKLITVYDLWSSEEAESIDVLDAICPLRVALRNPTPDTPTGKGDGG